MLSQKLVLLFFTIVFLGLVKSLSAQDGDPAARPTTPVHLVGHEDHELLDRVQDVIDDWDPRKLVNPVFKTTDVRDASGQRVDRQQLLRPDLAEFIADVEAAHVLGKAFFWDMQAGSDFRRTDDGAFVGTACASCHFRNGADARGRHARRFPYVVWDQYELDPNHNMQPFAFGEKQLPYPLEDIATEPYKFDETQLGNLSFINGSAGVEPQVFGGLVSQYQNGASFDVSTVPNGWFSEDHSKRLLAGFDRLPEWAMFIKGGSDDGQRLRQITARNSPSVLNSGFSDRLFHDGKAESTFNGYSIFGDRDHRPVLFRGVPLRDDFGKIVLGPDGRPKYGKPVQVHIAITKAALASQAVGPVVNDVEMSYVGRTFPNLACKLLDSRVLAVQEIKDDDSVLGRWKKEGLIGPGGSLTYRDLIKMAFRREWWECGTSPKLDENGDPVLDPSDNPVEVSNVVPLVLMGLHEDERRARGSLMIANFSLYWGLSIMMYESSLVSNQSPFDAMMLGNPKPVNQRWEELKSKIGTIRLDRGRHFNDELTEDPPPHKNGTSVFQHGLRVFFRNDCVECHSGPLFSELYERRPDDAKFPIHKLVSHTLIPNSRADSIAIRLSKFKRQTLEAIASELVSQASLDQAAAARWANELNLLREFSQGNQDNLESRVKSRLAPLFPSSVPDALAKEISELLIAFEKGFPAQLGERDFFSEKERLELAAELTEPVLVESMALREDQLQHRRPLPIKDPYTAEPSAFYDTAFYALGLTPGRYDRGIGGRIPQEEPAEEEIEDSFKAMKLQEFVVGLEPQLKASTELLEDAKQDFLRENFPDKSDAYSDKFKGQYQQYKQRILSKRATAEVNVARGQAYRFPVQIQSIRQYMIGPEDTAVDAPTDTPAVRQCHEGPSYDPDEAARQAKFVDTSWDRDDIPSDVRRSQLTFFSRARTLVVDEEPWGYRKPFLHDNELAFWGAFKTPTLRNVELTGPYMHNGRLQSLEDVIDFYDDGGFIEMDRELYPDKHPEMRPLHMRNDDKKALRFFLLCLTDQRVRLEQAPFDHPSLNVVNGYQATSLEERIQEVRAVGRRGWTKNGKPDPTQIPSSFPEN